MMDQRFDIAELERMRRFAAFMILEFGPEYGFVLERVEAMLEAAHKADPTARALKVLEELKSVHRAEDSAALKIEN
jgi:hypothetical protein